MVHYFMVADEFKKHETLLMNMAFEKDSIKKTLVEIGTKLNDLKKVQEAHLKELEVISEKIKVHCLEREELDKKLQSLDKKIKNRKEIIENTTILTPIIIDENEINYELLNGLVDVNRDIVMKLLRISKDRTKIRNIIGMAEIFYGWSKQRVFLWVKKVFGAMLLAWPRENDCYKGTVHGAVPVPHGRGRCVYSDGRVYEGEWEDGKIKGKGVMTWTNGDKYEGNWNNGTFEGKGIYTFGKGSAGAGDRYEGDHKSGKWDGKGIYTDSDGSRYEGGWEDNVRKGKGILSWPNGDMYIGDFSNDMINGQGVKTDRDGKVIHSGIWRNGLPVGGGWWFVK